MDFDFDQLIDRGSSDSIKWRRFSPDVLPLWIADMDFESPPEVLAAVRERAEHGVFGYPLFDYSTLQDLIVDRMAALYGWQIQRGDVIVFPGVVSGLNWACHAFSRPGDAVLVQTPIYPPFLEAPGNSQRERIDVELIRNADGSYAIDFDRFEAAITPQTSLFLLCNPHNPTGRVFTRAELERLAEICLRHHLVICSDEIHSDLVFSGSRHVPIASLAPEIAAQTVTMFAPSKTFNIAGLECSFAIATDREMHTRLTAARQGLVGWVNIFGIVAAEAAYRGSQPWLAALLGYLEANRDYLDQAVRTRMPGLSMHKPEGTYLAWIDCRQAELDDSPAHFFLDRARVGLNNGADFGPGGDGFIRLNFGCPRATLRESLDRMAAALSAPR